MAGDRPKRASVKTDHIGEINLHDSFLLIIIDIYNTYCVMLSVK